MEQALSPLQLIEAIVQKLKGKKIPLKARMDLVVPQLDALKTALGFTHIESAFMLSILFESTFTKGAMDREELLKMLGVSIFELIELEKTGLDELVCRDIIQRRSSFRQTSQYVLSAGAIDALIKGLPLGTNQSFEGLSNLRFIKMVLRYLSLHESHDIDLSELLTKIQLLLSKNQELPAPSLMLENGLNFTESLFLLALIATKYQGGREVTLRKFSRRYDEVDEFENPALMLDIDKLEEDLRSGDSMLIKKELVSLATGGGFRKSLTFVLNEKYIKKIFQDVDISLENSSSEEEALAYFTIREPQDVTPVELFYDDDCSELNDFRDILMGSNFLQLVERQKQMGITQNSLNIWLSGPSGTGKSSWIEQAAAMAGRRLYYLENTLKQAFFGDSEKAMVGMFKAYGDAVAQAISEGDSGNFRIPCLVIDEAESYFNNRKNMQLRGSVDTTLLTLTNILLNKISSPDFKGILVCTSNVTSQFIDDAFVRRFIHIEIPQPGLAARGLIWKNKFGKWLDEKAISRLSRVELSGGHIELVKKRFVNHYILKNELPDLQLIESWCESALRGWDSKTGQSIGFSLGGARE